MNPFKADLHCHSTCSDGDTSPVELLKMAVDAGLSGLSITDHDTIAAYRTAIPKAKELNLKLLPGVEFSSVNKQTPVHILGYAFHEESKMISDFCERHFERRQERNKEILELLSKHAIFLTEADLQKEHSGTPGRPHIALAMMRKGYVKTLKEAFTKYIGDHKPCYAQGPRFSVEETIEVIHRAGGLAVIAHPDQIKSSKTVKDLLSMGFDGIEVYYARNDPNSQHKWLQACQNRGWFTTGGSDYHGSIKPNNPIGCSWIGEETFQHLYIHYINNHATLH